MRRPLRQRGAERSSAALPLSRGAARDEPCYKGRWALINAPAKAPFERGRRTVHEGRDGRQPRRERPPRRGRQPSPGPSNYNRLRNPCWRRGRCATRRCAPHRLVKQVGKGARRIGEFPPRAGLRHSAEPCHDGRPDMPASWSASLQACRTCRQRGPASLSAMSDMPATRSGVVVSDVGHAGNEVRRRCQRCRTCPQRGPESLSAMSDMPATRSGVVVNDVGHACNEESSSTLRGRAERY